MEELDVLDEPETDHVRKRSTFLTVLCILTWVGSGAAILYYGYLFFLFSAMSSLAGSMGGTSGGEMSEMRRYMEWQTMIRMIEMIAPVFTIVGAVFMWKLRRWGFYLYTFGQLVPLALGIWFSLTLGDGFRGASLIVTVVMNIIPLGFIVMYAVNLKDMRR